MSPYIHFAPVVGLLGICLLSPVYISPLSPARSWAFSGRGPLSFWVCFHYDNYCHIFTPQALLFYISTFMLQYVVPPKLLPHLCIPIHSKPPKYPPFTPTYVGYSPPPPPSSDLYSNSNYISHSSLITTLISGGYYIVTEVLLLGLRLSSSSGSSRKTLRRIGHI